MPLRSETSSIETGSSATSTSGSRTIAHAIATRCRWPPDSSCGNRSRTSAAVGAPRPRAPRRPASRARRAVADPLAPPAARRPGPRWCAGVEALVRVLEDDLDASPVVAQGRPGHGAHVPVLEPHAARGDGREPHDGRPVVVLPEPDSPTSATISPLPMRRSTPSTARTMLRRHARASAQPAAERIVDPQPGHPRSSSPAARSADGRWLRHRRQVPSRPRRRRPPATGDARGGGEHGELGGRSAPATRRVARMGRRRRGASPKVAGHADAAANAISGGTTSVHTGIACSQRGWKRQPGGGSTQVRRLARDALGESPVARDVRHRPQQPHRVYGWRGR